jgi:hypothetical protein
MVEIVIERWTNADGSTDHLWSLWRDGDRLQFGRKHKTSEEAEAEALEFCHRSLGVQPDRVTRL